ncbi:hypothetical protein [Deminuibacter soli]|uniref:Uncharacterized protein n=1 Tax=Deminuibacter soli TaxID=2291815 RepID=A0A3E1NHI9_9BACT|nr:hypothetical protein [Deminuibacter soli]RFM27321.1 hypothetical protein DXN05_14935 [Deminuibacter soli]
MRHDSIIQTGDLVPPFIISFFYPYNGQDTLIKVTATVTLHPCGEYYAVDNFASQSGEPLQIRPQQIAIHDDTWVDVLTGTETYLSKILGDAIAIEITR